MIVVDDRDGNIFYRIIRCQGEQDKLYDRRNDEHANDAFVAEYLSEFLFQ